jgi:hypothetical protein
MKMTTTIKQVAIESKSGIVIVDAEIIERHALDTRNGKHTRPYTVRLADGRVLTVYDDEGDARCIPGEGGPARQGTHGWAFYGR